MRLTDIIIPAQFKAHPPGLAKLENCRAYYRANGKLDRRIVVEPCGVLMDGYVGYIVLCENGIEETDVDVAPPRHETTYVYGRHPNDAYQREYVWRVSHRTQNADMIHEGSRILVFTRNGPRVALVSRLEKKALPPLDQPIRKVIKCLDA